jgi:hypothetical protein
MSAGSLWRLIRHGDAINQALAQLARGASEQFTSLSPSPQILLVALHMTAPGPICDMLGCPLHGGYRGQTGLWQGPFLHSAK